MENAQLITLSRQIALQRQMDVVANNLANINTNGFKAQSILFSDYLMPVAADNEYTGVDRDLHYTEDWATVHDMSSGAIEQTGGPLDVALNGDGFFSVQTPQGVRYLRNGSFTLDSTGTLVDLNGNAVLGQSGPITFDASDTDISISPTGDIATVNGSKGKLAIVEFTDPQSLVREGDNYYSGGTPSATSTTRVVQGAVERSNVSGVSSMAEMIRVERAYQTLANLMQRQDDLRNSSLQKLASTSA